jgi:tetratricopeptide (TPR) repeat protein
MLCRGESLWDYRGWPQRQRLSLNVAGTQRKAARTPQSSSERAQFPTKPHLYFLLAIAILLIYGSVWRFDFVNYDDPDYVTENLHVRTGLTSANVAWAFTRGYAANWIPLTSISQMMDCQLFGLKSGWHHLTSLLFHTLSTLLLFGLFHRMTGSLWKSLFVAFVFGLHPLRVESVAWIAERKDVLGAFFWIVTLWSYLHYVERPSRRNYVLVALSLCLGLLSKPITVTLPLALLLLDIWPLKRVDLADAFTLKASRLVREKVPLFLLSAAACVITYVVGQRDGTIQSIQLIPLGVRFSNAFVSYATYLIKLVYPTNLAVFYPYPPPGPWQTTAAVMTVLLVSFLVLRSRLPYLLVGWFWYLGTLVPVLGIVQAGAQSHGDRYTYIPLIGISIMLAWGLTDFARKWQQGPAVLAGVAITVCAGWLILTWQQVTYWKDSESLFRHALAVTTGNYVAHNNYGLALRRKGRTEDAISHFRAALQIRPEDVEAHTNLGEALLAEGRDGEALPELLEALRLNPTYPNAHINLGVLLDRQGRTKEAAVQYQEAVDSNPDDAVAQSGLGSVLAALGQTDEGLRHLYTGIQLDPDDADGHYNLGVVLATLDRVDEAVAEFSEAVRLQPDDPKAHFNLGTAFASKDQMNEALEEFKTALRLRPAYANAELNLGKVLAYLERYDEAETHLSEALRLEPDLREARESLAAVQSHESSR